MSVFGSADWPRQLQGTVIGPVPSGSSASMCLASTRSRHMQKDTFTANDTFTLHPTSAEAYVNDVRIVTVEDWDFKRRLREDVLHDQIFHVIEIASKPVPNL